ncbi:hypothetical protein QQ045_028520 [Rhodiola kirilowii]
MKQAWRILKMPNLLMSRIMKAMYFEQSTFLESSLGHRPSHGWRSTWSVKNIFIDENGSSHKWKLSSGEFTCKSAYGLVEEYKIPDRITPGESSNQWVMKQFWQKVWKLNLPNKIKFFMWRLYHNGLPDAKNLIRRGCTVNSEFVSCGFRTESAIHVFKSCWWAHVFWKELCISVEALDVDCDFPADWVWYCAQNLPLEKFRTLACACWFMWYYRNLAVHREQGGQRCSPLEVASRGYCHGSFEKDNLILGFAVLIKGSESIDVVFAGWNKNLRSTLDAEVLAILRAMQVVRVGVYLSRSLALFHYISTIRNTLGARVLSSSPESERERVEVKLKQPISPRLANMYTTKRKIQKDQDAEPTEFEETVAQAFLELENSNQDLKSDLKDLYINSAIQVDVSGGRKAVVIHVPFRLRKAYRKVHVKLVRELEKKFSGKDVILIATRRIVRPPKKGSAVQRPRNRTLTAVHEAILEDVVLPAEIVGKRIRYRLDGSKIMKIFLDPKERNNTEYKLDTFSAVYRKLCGKDVVFEYPITDA